MSMLRFPLELPEVAKPRESWWRSFIGFVAVVFLVLLLIYGVGPAIEAWQEEAATEVKGER